jgi:hypothetical protein
MFLYRKFGFLQENGFEIEIEIFQGHFLFIRVGMIYSQ